MNNKKRIICKVNDVTIFYPVLSILLTLLLILKLALGSDLQVKVIIFFSCFVNLVLTLFLLIFVHTLFHENLGAVFHRYLFS